MESSRSDAENEEWLDRAELKRDNPVGWRDAEEVSDEVVTFGRTTKDCTFRLFFVVQRFELYSAKRDSRTYARHSEHQDAEHFPFILYRFKGGPRRVLEVKDRRERFQLPLPVVLDDGADICHDTELVSPEYTISLRAYAVRAAMTVGMKRLQRLATVEVDPQDIYHEIKDRIAFHVDVSGCTWVPTIMALWAMATYIFDSFAAFPYLYFNAERGSGKTRCLETLSLLSWMGQGRVWVNPNPSPLFRTTDALAAALCMDEIEHLDPENEKDRDILNLINAGYKVGARVPRTNPNTMAVEEFAVYCPKAFASIEPPEGAFASRCLLMPLQRSKEPGKFVEREPFREPYRSILGDIADECLVWALDHGSEIAAMDLPQLYRKYSAMFKGAPPRALEIMLPLLAVYESLGIDGDDALLGSEREALRMAVEAQVRVLTETATTDADERVLIALKRCVDDHMNEITSRTIIEKMEWEDDAEIRYFSPKRIGKILSKYHIPKRKTNGGIICYYHKVGHEERLAQLSEIMERYGMGRSS